MQINRNSFYGFLLICFAFAWVWIGFNLYYRDLTFNQARFTPCLIKQVTGYACPACGTTRSIVAFLGDGKWSNFLRWNILGFPFLIVLLFVPLWIGRDYIKASHSLYLFYQKNELLLGKKGIAISFFLLLLLNWIWNIYKGL